MTASSKQGPDQIESILDMFRASGGRITTGRRAIVSALLGGRAHRHLTAEQLAAQVQSDYPDIALSTVYRSLDALEEFGVVEHIHVGFGPAVYHLAAEQHFHLVCKQCGAVIEMPGKTLAALGREIRRRHGFEIAPRHFAITGLCENCRESP